MKFCGKYSGKYKKTIATGPAGPFSTPTLVTPSKGTAVVTISEAGCGAYLINIVEDGGKLINNDLAYLEDNVLRSGLGDGQTSTYFEDDRLIHQVSGRKNTNTNSEWIVVNFSLKKYKC